MTLFTKNTEKRLWLDLELREDIDDYATLLYALDSNLNVEVISIHNPSVHELRAAHYALTMSNSQASIIISGEVTEYPEGKDIHSSVMSAISPHEPFNHDNHESFKAVLLSDYLPNANFDDMIFFCGGSLATLANLVERNPERHFDAYIQGGYAGEVVTGPENVLKKFKGRKCVPSWNLNLDIEATKTVLSASNISCHFVSKNVCHDAWVDVLELSGVPTLFNSALKAYFDGSKWTNKCMHDLVAFLAIFNDELVEFVSVDLVGSDDERVKWHSVPNRLSNKKISINLNKPLLANFTKAIN